jgi:DNA-binding response OmpR family regulator
VAGQAEVFIKNGFDDFISKPVDIHQLDVVLNKFVPSSASALQSSPTKLVFVVSDDDEKLEAAASALEAEYQVMTMHSADKMVSLLSRKKADAILMEKAMFLGFEEGFEFKDIPVVFFEENFEAAGLAGIVGVVVPGRPQ